MPGPPARSSLEVTRIRKTRPNLPSIDMPTPPQMTATPSPLTWPRLVTPIAALSLVLAAALAGPLEPPAGPVADSALSPTNFKTLAEVEPRININTVSGVGTALYLLDRPGSYYLSGNITATAGRNGLVIASDNITIDLNGFALIGVSGAGDGISYADPARYYRNIEVRNGTIRNWPGSGINIQADNVRVDAVRLSNNSLAAINLNGSLAAIVTGCTMLDNVGGGIFAGNAAIIEKNTINVASTLGDGPGISVADASVVRDNMIRGTRGSGILAGATSTIERNTIVSARQEGINVGARSIIRNNLVTASTLTGITLAGAQCLVADNHLTNNAPGSTTNGGLVSTQNNHRIENNTFSGNGQGLRLTGNGSFIARNTFRQNTGNFQIQSTNSIGPFVTVSLGGDISTNSNANNAHPWANFIH